MMMMMMMMMIIIIIIIIIDYIGSEVILFKRNTADLEEQTSKKIP